MKKFYLLLSAACVAASASAVEKEMAVAKASTSIVMPQTSLRVAAPLGSAKEVAHQVVKTSGAKKAGVKKAGASDDYVYYRPADNIMSIGTSVNGYGYSAVFGFASSNGNLVFNNYSAGVKSSTWTYAEVGDYNEIEKKWNTATTESNDLVLKSSIGECMTPELSVVFNSGATGNAVAPAVSYLCGGGASFWGLGDEKNGDFGVSFYQNSGMKDDRGYNGSNTNKSKYSVGTKGFNENGVYVDKSNKGNWQTLFENKYEGKKVTNLAFDNFTLIQPEPASAYILNEAWGWFSVSASGATQLTSYIYPIDEDGYISDTAIAVGTAAVPKGDSSNLDFFYTPLNEDGDEEEGVIVIDSAVAITIEGFAGNDKIKQLYPVSGFYPFSYNAYAAGNYDLCKDPDTYMHFTYDVDGEPTESLSFDTGLYYFTENDEDTVTSLTYAQFVLNASFNYINSSVETVAVPLTGGQTDVVFNALYYNIPELLEEGVYEISTPDWVTVSFGESQQNGETPATIKVDASETDREGVISLSGLGVTCDIKVVQGNGGAVNVVVADGEAQYYDLAGRRVMNPDKGIYIKKAGNKAEKVVL